MEKIKDFLNSEQTFFKVLDILNQHGDMSQVGQNFVAGGSVANTLFYLFHGAKLVINDIDVYHRSSTEEHKLKTGKDWYPAIYVGEDGLQILDDNYGRTFIADNGSKIKVHRHSRKGIFNNIEYFYAKGFQQFNKEIKPKELVILEGFDLNCCGAGLDMLNSKIIYTPEFVNFLKTKQLEVINPCSPIQTSIRLYKKMNELEGVYCDVEHEMRYLTVAAKKISAIGGNQISTVIGLETKNKYDKYKSFVEKYFILRKPNANEIPYGVSNEVKKDIWTYDPVLNFDIIEQPNNSLNGLRRIWELLYRNKKKSEQNKINKIFYKNVFLGDMTEDIWSQKVYVMNEHVFTDQYREEPTYHSERFTYKMILAQKNFYKCDFSLEHVDQIDKFVKEHYNLQSIIKHCKTLTEQYNIVKFIKSLAKKEGTWVIGILETIEWQKYRDNFDGVTKEFILKVIEDGKIVHSEELTTRLNISDFKYKSNVRELITSLDLISEGKKMGTCVGGYSKTIKSGHSRIFHIECNGIGSTVEVILPPTKIFSNKERKYFDIVAVHQLQDFSKCIVSNGNFSEEFNTIEVSYRLGQHTGRSPQMGNMDPTLDNKKIVREFLNYLNTNQLPDNYFKWELDLEKVFESLA